MTTTDPLTKMSKPESSKVAVYRLRCAKGTLNTSWGEWRYFEDREKFEEALIIAALEVASSDSRNPQRARFSAFGTWLREHLGIGVKTEEVGYSWRKEVKVTSIVGAEILMNHEWHAINFKVLPPTLEYEVSSEPGVDRFRG